MLHTTVNTVATLTPSKLRQPRISSGKEIARAQLPQLAPMAVLTVGDARRVRVTAEHAACVAGHVGRSFAPLEKPSTLARAILHRPPPQLAGRQLPAIAHPPLNIVVPSLSPPRTRDSPLKRTRAARGSPPTDEDGEARPALLPITRRVGRIDSAACRTAGKALAAGRRLAAARAAFADDVFNAHPAGPTVLSIPKIAPSSIAPAAARVRASSASVCGPARKRLPVADERAQVESVRVATPLRTAVAPTPERLRRDAGGLLASRPPELVVEHGADFARDGVSVSSRSFSPPLVPASARRHNGADARWSERPQRSSSTGPSELKPPPALEATRMISLRYDSTLCCYFDPISHKYYELR
jgi:hypothetical protein